VFAWRIESEFGDLVSERAGATAARVSANNRLKSSIASSGGGSLSDCTFSNRCNLRPERLSNGIATTTLRPATDAPQPSAVYSTRDRNTSTERTSRIARLNI
jgi:hypothetical protein